MTMTRVAVIGAGLMGHGIAQVFALASHDVTIHDSVAERLAGAKARILANLEDLGDDVAAVERVRPCQLLADAVREADFVVEAVLEDLPLKQQLFTEIERHVRADTILASNTSVIPITSIMESLRDRSRALGTHWWNPPYLVPLVEVIGTQWTSPPVIERTMALHRDAGKMPVHVKKDVAGLGPLENADLVGTDLTLAIHRTVLPAIESRGGPSPYLEALVADGKLGFKSGEGFRKWNAEQQAALRGKLMLHLKQARASDV
jgi:3-hydroxybutyryl-CoA dehydrogenase